MFLLFDVCLTSFASCNKLTEKPAFVNFRKHFLQFRYFCSNFRENAKTKIFISSLVLIEIGRNCMLAAWSTVSNEDDRLKTTYKEKQPNNLCSQLHTVQHTAATDVKLCFVWHV
jgi:hypothetical protein